MLLLVQGVKVKESRTLRILFKGGYSDHSFICMMHSTILPGLTRSASPVGRFVKGKSVINSPDMKPQDLPLLYPLSSIRACMYKQAENRIMSLR